MNKSIFMLLLLLISWVMLSGCEPQKPQLEDHEMISMEISDVNVWLEELEFDFKVDNNSPKDIWICIEMDYDGLPYETKIYGNTLLIKLKSFERSDQTLLDHPPLPAYFRLPSCTTEELPLTLTLPVTNWSPTTSEPNNVTATRIIERVVFELGFFTEDLSGETAEIMKEESTDEWVYLDNQWDGFKREQTLRAEITGVKIPCFVLS